jgi:positive phototaxis protein PixI
MIANTNLSRLEQLLPQLFQPEAVTGDAYLRFQLTHEIPVLLSMARVQEALLVPASSISSLPNLPALTIGIMNSRDRVFCVVDLGQLLGLPPMSDRPRNYQVIVIYLPSTGAETSDPSSRLSTKCLGLAVGQVREIARFETATLQSAVVGECPECLMPYLLGCFVEAERPILVLDPVAIVNAPTLQQNPFV